MHLGQERKEESGSGLSNILMSRMRERVKGQVGSVGQEQKFSLEYVRVEIL